MLLLEINKYVDSNKIWLIWVKINLIGLGLYLTHIRNSLLTHEKHHENHLRKDCRRLLPLFSEVLPIWIWLPLLFFGFPRILCSVFIPLVWDLNILLLGFISFSSGFTCDGPTTPESVPWFILWRQMSHSPCSRRSLESAAFLRTFFHIRPIFIVCWGRSISLNLEKRVFPGWRGRSFSAWIPKPDCSSNKLYYTIKKETEITKI